MQDEKLPKFPIAPVYEVIFQIRFPKILKISQEVPQNIMVADFQDKIRDTLSLYEYVQQIPNAQIPIPGLIIPIDPIHQFKNNGGTIVIGLNSESINVKFLGDYIGFDDIQENIDRYINDFMEIFNPGSFSRIGIMYQNIIPINFFGHWSDKNINDIIHPNFKDFIFHAGIKNIISSNFQSSQTLELAQDLLANYTREIATAKGSINNKPLNNIESYIFNIDVFSNSIEGKKNVTDFTSRAKRYIDQLFRASISEQAISDLLSIKTV